MVRERTPWCAFGALVFPGQSARVCGVGYVAFASTAE
jgi:hypothetical protein